jgi:hypothetical protein
MLLVRNFRNRFRGTPYHVSVLCTALLALLFVRFTAPTLPEISSTQLTIVCHSAHNQRPCFDHDELGWSAPVAFLAIAPPEVSLHLPSSSELILPFQTKGSHYNRPPPLT